MALTLALAACSPESAAKTAKSPPTVAAVKSPPPGSPLVWFAPLDPVPREVGGGSYTGLEDFYELFSKNAAWSTAAGHIQVFKFYTQLFDQPDHATDAQLRQIVAELNRRHIAIALELGPMTPTPSCGSGIEGQGGVELSLRIMQQIQDAGGIVRYIAMDEPFLFWSLDTRADACHYSVETVARDVAAYQKAIRSSFPNVVIGDIEGDHASLADMKRWVDGYHAVTGSELQFLHWDVDWQTHPGWATDALALQTYVRGRGIPFGLIYNGSGTDKSDEAWLHHAEDHLATFEALLDGHPDHVIFQSWHPYPKHALPESSPTTFTHLIDRYFDARSSIRLDIATAASSRKAVGTLMEKGGGPIPGAEVSLSIRPLDGPGSPANYDLSGVVPAGASSAVVGLRVNMEGAGPGAADVSIYSASYRQQAEPLNRVPNGNFGRGLQTWGVIGGRLQPSDRGGGSMLRYAVASGQAAMANSGTFSVSAGTNFTLSFAARVSPRSTGSGYFAVFFLNGKSEVERQTLPIEAAAIHAGARTDAAGQFTYTWPAPSGQHVEVRAAWPGDDKRLATVAITSL